MTVPSSPAGDIHDFEFPFAEEVELPAIYDCPTDAALREPPSAETTQSGEEEEPAPPWAAASARPPTGGDLDEFVFPYAEETLDAEPIPRRGDETIFIIERSTGVALPEPQITGTVQPEGGEEPARCSGLQSGAEGETGDAANEPG